MCGGNALIFFFITVFRVAALPFTLPFGREDTILPQCTHVWDGVAFVGSPIDILPVGDKLVSALAFDCLHVAVDAALAFCGSHFELLLTNGEQHIVNTRLECPPELPCREVRLNPLHNLSDIANFTARRPTKWVLRYTNEGGTALRPCAEHKLRLAMSVRGPPTDRLCPATEEADCGGHGWCSINTGRCVCFEHPDMGFWNCTAPDGEAGTVPGRCSCTECLRPWAGEGCTAWTGPSRRLPTWAWVLFLIALALSVVVVAAMSLTLQRYKRIIDEREEYAPIAETATQPFRVEHTNAPSLRTKLYF